MASDEHLGVERWNRLPGRERRYWLDRAGAYSALDPASGLRVLLPVGWHFDRDGALKISTAPGGSRQSGRPRAQTPRLDRPDHHL